MDVTLPDFYIYDASGNYTSYPPLNKYITGSLFYSYDTQDRMTLETTYSGGNPTFEDYTLSGGNTLYNANWNYPTAADPAENLTMIRGNSQSFNADNQLTTETYDGEGNRTSYDGGTVLYDANDLPTSVPGSGGATPFTQTFTSEGERAWKLPSGGSKTYYLYDNGAVLLELSSTGSPVNTYAYGPSGLLERYQHTNVGVPYVMYLYDPNGNPVHRVRSIDPNTSSGAAVFVQDTAIYDSQGLLHADIDTLTGGFNSGHLDPIGYKGELGNYTDLETQRSVSGLYTALSGPGGTLYYDPMSGVAMARSEAASANEYANNLAPVEHALHEGFVGVAGIVGYSAGPIGSALAAGAIDSEITYLEGNDAKTSLLSGAKTAAFGLVLGKAGEIVSGPVSRYLASEAFGSVAPTFARAVSYFARKGGPGCFTAGTPVQMADGTTKPIEQVKIGDLVKSRNPKTGQTEAKRVLQTTVRQTDQVLTLALTDPKTGHQEWITTTGEHPFYVEGQGFVKAGDLGIGTSIVTRAGPTLTLSHLTWQNAPSSQSGLLLDSGAHQNGYTVYNLIVDGDHTYFVGTTGGGAWVHNVNCYPIHFEMQLNINEFGRGEKVHFNRALVSLEAALKSDAALLDRLSTVSGKTSQEILDAVARKGGRETPEWFTWHHATREQAGGREGVMQLVSRQHHIDNHGLYHPTGIGGYEQWARPNGAPPR